MMLSISSSGIISKLASIITVAAVAFSFGTGIVVANEANKTETKSKQCLPLNLIFLLDQSSSVNPSCMEIYDIQTCTAACGKLAEDPSCIVDNFSIEKNFVNSIIQGLDISKEGGHVSLLRYSSTNAVTFDLKLDAATSYDKALIEKTLNDIPFDGGYTHTAEALTKAVSHAHSSKQAEKGMFCFVAVVLSVCITVLHLYIHTYKHIYYEYVLLCYDYVCLCS